MDNRKSINKSVRLTPKVYNYIESYQGNGFNEKFENIILEAMELEAERKKRIQVLDGMIADKLDDYNILRDKIKDLDKFLLVAVKANNMIKQLDDVVKEIVSQN